MRSVLHITSSVALLLAAGARGQGDLCAGATVVSCGSVVSGSTGAPYTADVAPFCGTGDGTGGGVWYRIVGTGVNTTASLCGSGYDTRIRVYTGTCAALVCTIGNDDFCGLQSQVTWMATSATVYYILVHGYGAATGAYTLTITCAAPPVPMCYSTTATPYLADPYAGTPVALTDDWHSAVVPLGFTFCYNGTSYSSCVIASNNYISFDPAVASTYSPWPTVAVPATTPTQISASILNPWQDINPGVGGSIYYQTLGNAPYRRFVVSYLNVPMFSCTQMLYTSQTVLYESTNCIGSYILTKPVCTTWNSGNAVHALHNTGGTSAATVAGRNNTQWTANAQGMFFVPTCTPCSTSTTAQCIQMILPVELLHFDGYNDGSANVLRWATASEQNTATFTVERAVEGEAFLALEVLPAAGNSNQAINYSIRDESPATGVNLYRLRTTDQDGEEELSEVVAIQHVPSHAILAYPNPTHGVVGYSVASTLVMPAELVIRDLAGRTVSRAMIIAPTGTIPVDHLAPGSYLLSVPAVAGASVPFAVE